jgi:hypothetical protein
MIEAIAQFGVIPRRRDGDRVEVLLITSRDTRRWVVPRGNPIRGCSPAEAAAREAFEEAGIRGVVSMEPLGSYRYEKRRPLGRSVPAEVQIFAMDVTEEFEEWPEMRERERRWFGPKEAAAAVAEPDLASLILSAGGSG